MGEVTSTHGAGHNEVLYEIEDGHIATITLNAPERMNTISGPMLNELTKLLIRANEDPDVRCVILTGSAAPSARDSTCARRARRRRDQRGVEPDQSRPAQHAADRAARNGQADDLRAQRRRGRLRHGHGARLRHPHHGGIGEIRRRLRQARRAAGIGRHVVPAAHDRLGEGVGTDLHRPHAERARDASTGAWPTRSCPTPN